MQTPDKTEQIPLKDAVRFALEEARVVVPGIQALFGFQLAAVFNERFEDVFEPFQQGLHVVALALVALAAALAMAPSAYHRQVERGHVSVALLDRASALIGASMLALMLAIAIDLGLVTYAVSQSTPLSLAVGAVTLAVIGALWIAFPRWARRARTRAR